MNVMSNKRWMTSSACWPLSTNSMRSWPLVEKRKAVQTKQEEEMKVRARMLAEAAMAEVRQVAKCVNECTKDAAQKATEELQRLQSLEKGKQ